MAIHLRLAEEVCSCALISVFIRSAYIGRRTISSISLSTTSSVILSLMLFITYFARPPHLHQSRQLFQKCSKTTKRDEVDTFVYVMNSFGVDLSGLSRIQTHTCPSASQEHSMIFPEQKAGSKSSAVEI